MHATSGGSRSARWRRLPAIAALAAVLPLTAAFTAPRLAPAPPAAAARLTASTTPAGPIVRTRDGQLQGKYAEGISQFLGVRYAAPPVGALRWQAPQPARPWRGVRPATSYGNRCPQLPSGNGPRADTEDCLFLNVFAPAGSDPAAAPRGRGHGHGLPVLFMIHGGGLTTGAGDQHDGALIVNDDHIIVVSINYRLGVFGFLDVPGLSHSPLTANGNFGLLDQEAALRWVHRNIAAFGGDPDRVTIAGESAGGWSVCALMTSPLARGLFSGAIMESGSCASRTPADARSAGLAFAAQAGCPAAAAAASCLRGLPEATLLTASASYSALFASAGPELPVPPATAVAEGRYAKVPLLMGTNHDEGRTFTQGFAYDTEQQYVQQVDQQYGAQAPAVLAHYPWSAYASPYTAAYALGAIWTDSGFVTGIGGCPTQNLAATFARRSPTFFFQFDDRHAPGLNRSVPGYQWGAGHAMELAYLWPSFDNGYSLYDLLTPAQLQLSRQMVEWWGAFTRLGVPTAAGQPAWPSYASGRLMSLRPGDRSRTIPASTFAAEHQCAFWNAQPAG
ncbi:MAG TPA: carboxylesterase family protein [Streptosporangiaceae bacterium]|nr:carboxylesterase family protein [Streptosporangiaceae bacterium]